MADEGVLAEQAGVDFSGIGEHHTDYFPMPAVTRFDLEYGVPGLTHAQLMTTIDLYGREVIPRVRDLLT